mmetsp:Transcript_82262/g.164429  ORF Transcript_82262/g.164429 Transcript_82262/m.164429 type:complete len:103 (+) Transcript_82262:206-514(+)
MSLFQAGAIDLQWPHQGAKNLMKTDLPAVASSKFSGVNTVAEPLDNIASARRIKRVMVIWTFPYKNKSKQEELRIDLRYCSTINMCYPAKQRFRSKIQKRER